MTQGPAPYPKAAAPSREVRPQPMGGAQDPTGEGLNPGERRWLWGWVLFLLLLSSLPYLLAWGHQTAAWRFTGFLFAVEDGHAYLAKMLWGRVDGWRWFSPYTVMPQQGYWLYGFHLLLGKVSRLLPWPPPVATLVMYHGARLVAYGLLAVTSYRFVALWLPTPRQRRWATVLLTLGSGLDWVLLPWPQWWGMRDGPPSWVSPEAFGFLMGYGLPHLALGRALALAALRRVGRGEGRPWGTALLAAGVMACNPLMGASWAWAGLWLWGAEALRALREDGALRVARAKAWLKGRGDPQGMHALAALLPVALGLGYAFALRRDPYIASWEAQNLLPGGTWLAYLLAYGWLLPWAWPTLRTAQGRRWLGWALSTLFLTALPFTARRRLLEGAWLAWVLLATWPGRRLRGLALGLLGPALFLGATTWLAVGRPPQLPLYRPAAEGRAFAALAAHAHPGDHVLAAYATGNALPAWAPVRVPAGLGPESPHLEDALRDLATFFDPATSDAWRRDLLQRWGIRWVFYGPAERALGAWSPEAASYLCRRYQAEGYAFYEVCAP